MNNPGTPLIAGTQKPGMVTAIGVMTIISGILNIIAGLGIGGGLAVSVVLICIAPVGILPIVLGVFEIIYAVKLLSNPPQPVQPNQTIAILEIVCFLFGNMVSGITGVLALVFYNDANVKAYFASLNDHA
jgi:uncharacterized membrane protein HdeD (DUF308 family)